MSSSLYQIEKLDENNYDGWKIQMKSVLVHSDLWTYVNGSTAKPEGGKENAAAQSVWITKDEKALATILLCLKPSQLNHVKRCKTSKEAWKKLEEIHQPRGPARKVTLFKKLIQTKMSEGQSVSEHLNLFFDVVEKLSEIGISLIDSESELLSIILLSSLPKSYESFVIAIESRDTLPSTFALKTKLLEEGQRRENGSSNLENPGEQSYFSKTKNKFKRESNNSNSNSKPFTGKCYICRKRGHYAANCRQKGLGNKDKKSDNNNASFAMLNVAAIPSLKNAWIIDSGATSHMCCNRSMYISFKEVQEKIELAADKYIRSVGIGDVMITVKDIKVTLRNVLYVPTLKSNFISVSKAVENGYKVHFNEHSVEIKRDNKIMVCGKKINNLFVYTNDKDYKGSLFSCTANEKSDSLKWHERFGHINMKNIIMMKNKNMVRGLDEKTGLRSIDCEICAKCKISAKPFPSYSEIRSKDVLDIIHSDICGPMRKFSNGGAKYFALFIDDYSRKIFVYFLKNKSDILEKFKEFKTFVENHTGKRIKVLRTDNGREYTSVDFSKYLTENGIRHQLTVEYTPQQNGVSERANRTLVEMARCMLMSSGLSESFWAEAINTAVYIKNRSPTQILGEKTPYEMWNGIKPSVTHFRPFGCKAIMLDKRPGRSKFQSKGIECVLTGYCQDTKAYRLYEVPTRKIYKSRDVIFMEQSGNKSKLWYNDNYVIADPQINENVANGEIPEIMEAKTEVTEEEQVAENEEKHSQESSGSENLETNTGSVKRGRPRILRTGNPGRPRKLYPFSLNILKVESNEEDKTKNPLSVKEALSREDSEKWQQSMNEEYTSLLKKGTWELVNLPPGRKPIKSKWVFNIKRDKDGNIERYKARLVAKGCNQKFGIDFKETYSPVARYSTIRMILSLAVEYGLLVHQIDVTSAYLNSELTDEIYMEQPEGYVNNEHPNKVCRLKKALYGLKQSGYEWNKKLDVTLKEIGFIQCVTDNCVYVMNRGKEYNIIVVYVDDLMLVSSKESTLNKIKNEIELNFEIIDKGPIDYYLGIEIERQGDRGKIKMSQKQFIQDLLERYEMQNCRKCSTPLDPGIKLKQCEQKDCQMINSKVYQSIIGSLMYIGISTRPDILHSVCRLAQFNNHAHSEHMAAIKHLLRYLKCTIDLKLTYAKTGEKLQGFADADWANSSDRKSYSGILFMLAGGAVSWESNKQTAVALSSTEAEYVAISGAAKEAVYLKKLLTEIGFSSIIEGPTIINNDNLSAQRLVKNQLYHSRTKHIDIKIHYVREIYNNRIIDMAYIPTEDMVADILTKNLNKIKHLKLTKMLGLD